MERKLRTRQLVESAVLLALGFILSMLKIKLIPGGGSVTLASMLPIVFLAFKYGPAWGTLCGFIHGMLQVVEGGGLFPPADTALSYILVFILDYALAWAAVGLIAGLVRNMSKSPRISVAAGAALGILGRFACSFTSGVIIWASYAPEGQSPVVYSLLQNATVFLPEIAITAFLGFTLMSVRAIGQSVLPPAGLK